MVFRTGLRRHVGGSFEMVLKRKITLCYEHVSLTFSSFLARQGISTPSRVRQNLPVHVKLPAQKLQIIYHSEFGPSYTRSCVKATVRYYYLTGGFSRTRIFVLGCGSYTSSYAHKQVGVLYNGRFWLPRGARQIITLCGDGNFWETLSFVLHLRVETQN